MPPAREQSRVGGTFNPHYRVFQNRRPFICLQPKANARDETARILKASP
jgi:hypothetical protein